MPPQVRHHEGCFGCGRTNLFGLLLELERTEPGRAAGRCFIKQDHQGPTRGFAHEGVIAAVLSDAMALATGEDARATRLELELIGSAPVGTFVELEVELRQDGVARAHALVDGEVIARAAGAYRG